MKNLVLIGSGNVATHLGIALKNKGYNILQVWSMQAENAKVLADKLDCKFTSSLYDLEKADLYITSVKDDKIEEVISNLQNVNIVHTSGSIGLEIFKLNFTNFGVFYPLQTFNKEVDINFSEIPLCIEANNSDFEKELLKIGESLSNSVVKMNSEQRKQLHIAAVFACNFSNHMFSIADDILQKSNVDFNLLQPLIRKTIKKIEKHSPKNVQTGPAKRNDKKIIESHLQSLEKNQQEVYKLITNSIISNND
tara:strand:+ start:326 stop:1078 length:753 start_codon:yes stop_codon:yes gene_type:complete